MTLHDPPSFQHRKRRRTSWKTRNAPFQSRRSLSRFRPTKWKIIPPFSQGFLPVQRIGSRLMYIVGHENMSLRWHVMTAWG